MAVDENGNEIAGGFWANGKTANPHYEWLRDEGEPFRWRSYGVFAFLAGVRNYSDVTPISEPRGLPADVIEKHTDEDGYTKLGDHSFSWLSVAELDAFDYDDIMEDRRVTRKIANNFWNGAHTAEPGGGKEMTWRDFLGGVFFKDLEELKRIGAHRVVFGFDS